MEKIKRLEVFLLVFILVINLVLFVLILNPRISGFSVLAEKSNTPFDFISEDKISTEGNKVIIAVDNPILTRYSDSGSMNPVLNEGTTGIEIKPKTEVDIHVGDIITFRQRDILIVHRVIEIGKDAQGTYFITKGDNNNADDGKIRFNQVDSILVAIIY